MPDLSINFCGVRSPNPFWLASGPPANSAYQVMRAFDAGWGGAVWKTIGEPIINTGSRYGSIDLKNERMIGLNSRTIFLPDCRSRPQRTQRTASGSRMQKHWGHFRSGPPETS